MQALEEAKQEKESHGEMKSPHPGFLVAQDTYYVGYSKGVGKIFQRTSIDTHSNTGFAKLYLEKKTLTAAHFLNDKLFPYFEEHNITVLRMLTDTKVRKPQTNGAVER